MRGILSYLLCVALLAQGVAFGVAGHADCGASHDCAGMQAGKHQSIPVIHRKEPK